MRCEYLFGRVREMEWSRNRIPVKLVGRPLKRTGERENESGQLSHAQSAKVVCLLLTGWCVRSSFFVGSGRRTRTRFGEMRIAFLRRLNAICIAFCRTREIWLAVWRCKLAMAQANAMPPYCTVTVSSIKRKTVETIILNRIPIQFILLRLFRFDNFSNNSVTCNRIDYFQ